MDTELKPGIHWVGYIDWHIRDFHSYITDRGATYNAYLVQDESAALIDTVKAPYYKNLLHNIETWTDPATIDYIVVNHAEPDHASALPKIVEALPNATIVCNAKCKGILEGYNETAGWTWKIVQSGETLSLGNRTLQFFDTPMVHWPDSMVTYVPEEKLLFSMDAFGQHVATSARFDDLADLDQIMAEARKYYANIVMPYGKQVVKAIEALSTLEIEMIAPSHGVIWRSHIPTILEAYQDWVVCRPKPKVLVLFDTMWDSTRMMADAIIDGAAKPGILAKPIHVRATTDTETVADVLDAACIAVGSATFNQTLMPTMAGTLTYIKGLRPTNKAGFAFGSHGWGKGSVEAISEYLDGFKWDILRQPILSKWRPTKEILKECREAGAMLAEEAQKRAEALATTPA